MYKEGFDIDPLVAFLHNLYENPSNNAINELYGFLEAGNLPITSDGHFLAYKKVNDNYTDCHTGKIDNSVGQVVEMPRNEVDDNRENTCSHGLHFCSLDYLKHFHGARIVILKINPKDVVSIPSGYWNTKGRCCRYVVVGEVEDFYKPEETFTHCVHSEYDEEEDTTWEDDYYEDDSEEEEDEENTDRHNVRVIFVS